MKKTPSDHEPDIPEGDFEDLPEGDGVLIISVSGHILCANLQAERILKRRLSRGQTITSADIFSREYLPQAEVALSEALRNGLSRSNLVAAVRLESGLPVSVTYGVSPLVDRNDEIIGLVLTFHENGSHPKAAGSSPTDTVEYDTLFENLAEGVFTINTRWRITSFNRRAQEITGYQREDVLGRFCWDIFKSDLCRTACPLKTTMETGVMRMDQDVRIVGRKGRLSILVNTSVLKDKHDRVIGAVESFRPLNSTTHDSCPEKEACTPLEIIGRCPPVVRLLQQLPDIAAADASVVLEGESGTGKELFARAIHTQSPRRTGPFIAVNCSALAETLLESELFGHEKAAFTGALHSRVGRFELARGGTLFLDEVADIKPDIQVKLLRVLQERVFERVGGTRPITMDARIIAATNRNLLKEVKNGRFRRDLYYRLRTVPLHLPPLRERVEDIPILVNHFLTVMNTRYHKAVRGIDPKVMAYFCRYAWPGNVRELERVLEYAFVFVKGPVITMTHLPEMEAAGPLFASTDHAKSTEQHWDERLTIERALAKAKGRRLEAARALGISRSSLWRKMKAYGLRSD